MKITYFYTTQEQLTILLREEKKYSFQIEKKFATYENCLQLAQEAEADGSFLLVASGFQYDALQKRKLRIPLVQEMTTLSTYWSALYEITRDLKKPHPTLLLCPSWELEPKVVHALEDIFQIRILEFPLTPEEVQSQSFSMDALLSVVRNQSCDAVIGPIILEKKLQTLPVPVYKSTFYPLAKECIVLTLNHISQIIQFWEEQQKLNSRTEMMMKQSFSAVFCLNEQGNIQVWNAYAEYLFQRTADELLGTPLWKIFSENDQVTLQNTIEGKKNLLGYSLMIRDQPFAVSSTYFPQSKEFIFHFSELSTQQGTHTYGKGRENYGHTARYHFSDIIGSSPSMQETKKYAQHFARYNSSVLICGESGTGKEMFSQSIHNESLRKEGPFVAINCSTIPASLMESELFGYAGGAFTGASRTGKQGLFEAANYGTIFLDEISEMSFGAQAQLLRVLAEKSLMRVGEHVVRTVDVRVIAATNRNLLQMVQENKFRADLYYRLNVLSLEIEPLRQRREDILPTFDYYFHKLSRQEKKYVSLTEEARRVLEQYSWPGNVRQLRNFCERLIVVAEEECLDASFIQKELRRAFQLAPAHEEKEIPEEKKLLLEALRRFHGNRRDTADYLGIHPSTLWRRMKKWGL